jgi:hypothetical protein
MEISKSEIIYTCILIYFNVFCQITKRQDAAGSKPGKARLSLARHISHFRAETDKTTFTAPTPPTMSAPGDASASNASTDDKGEANKPMSAKELKEKYNISTKNLNDVSIDAVTHAPRHTLCTIA